MPELKVAFAKERETKNTVRFEEEPREGSEPAIGTLYVQKQALLELGSPTRLNVTIEAPPPEQLSADIP
jgi:hypothetical protein